MRTLRATPERLVEKDGTINFGSFRHPFKDLNILDSPIYSNMKGVPRLWKSFRLKEWQHFGIITPRHYLGMVIFAVLRAAGRQHPQPPHEAARPLRVGDGRSVKAVSFVYFYDRERNKRYEHSRQAQGGAARIARQLYSDYCAFSRRGYSMRYENRLEEGYHLLNFSAEERKGIPAMRGELKVLEDLYKLEPLVQVSPIKPGRPFYTHKVAAPVEGWVKVGNEEFEVSKERDLALMDEQKTFYPYRSFWEWATSAGYDERGRMIAFNLCRNMIIEDSEHNENCIWVDGQITLLGAARFQFDPHDHLKPWEMKTLDQRVKLEFAPLGERAERINLGLALSDFHQPFGFYSGKLEDKDGQNYSIDKFFGVAESHITRY